MIDLRNTIAAKSDQLNADDLIGAPRTITITDVSIVTGDQPVAISYEGDNGKPWKPCKSMRRVLVQVWGHDGKLYIGRALTLFRDEKVAFGGQSVGGIRISHMSDILSSITMSLTNARASKKPFTVQPLKVNAPIKTPKAEMSEAEKAAYLDKFRDALIAEIEFIESFESVELFLNGTKVKMDSLIQKSPERHAEVMIALTAKQESLKDQTNA